MDTNPIKKAALIVGSRVALAEKLGVSKGAVWQWEHETKPPAEKCPAIERLTAGEVRCEHLRPDVDWADRVYVPQTQEAA